MAKRDWRKDRKLRMASKNLQDKDSVAELAAGAGTTRYSKAAGAFMPPSRAKRINPNSPEGIAIASRYKDD